MLKLTRFNAVFTFKALSTISTVMHKQFHSSVLLCSDPKKNKQGAIDLLQEINVPNNLPSSLIQRCRFSTNSNKYSSCFANLSR